MAIVRNLIITETQTKGSKKKRARLYFNYMDKVSRPRTSYFSASEWHELRKQIAKLKT